jgi:hypothetical protein
VCRDECEVVLVAGLVEDGVEADRPFLAGAGRRTKHCRIIQAVVGLVPVLADSNAAPIFALLSQITLAAKDVVADTALETVRLTAVEASPAEAPPLQLAAFPALGVAAAAILELTTAVWQSEGWRAFVRLTGKLLHATDAVDAGLPRTAAAGAALITYRSRGTDALVVFAQLLASSAFAAGDERSRLAHRGDEAALCALVAIAGASHFLALAGEALSAALPFRALRARYELAAAVPQVPAIELGSLSDEGRDLLPALPLAFECRATVRQTGLVRRAIGIVFTAEDAARNLDLAAPDDPQAEQDGESLHSTSPKTHAPQLIVTNRGATGPVAHPVCELDLEVVRLEIALRRR